ncbi:nucleotidyltransferase family protein [Faecalicoccus pleomorphus]|uniref:nucleotidyltransferase family protein n=1 Tax=Faecalicoccus pleomorphus TaxID=1323 RepID=UPI0019605710|nr:nucleotidyltransferase family protein [Faecalicoccus pleomorphus]MBM6809377.1 nucleotidyltransferase family protein [Faecalicoccus pleomorphus]
MGKQLFLKNEQTVVCQLLSNVLFGKEISIPTDVDFEKVEDCASKQAVITPALLNINEYKINANLKQKIISDLISQTSSIAQNYFHHQYLHNLMKKYNIPYCIMKGVASSRYYPSSMIRQMGDVDFIVKTEYLKKVDQILKEDGFHCWNMKHCFHEVYTKDNMHFELHFDFGGYPVSYH